MSYTFAVWDGQKPESATAAVETLERLDQEYPSGSDVEPTEGIALFLRDLLARWPDISDEAGEASPWADGPLRGNASGPVLLIGVVYSQLQEATDFLVEMAQIHDLVLFDPQEDVVLSPPGVPARVEQTSTTKRRWFRRS